jgi:hypothetical protein
MQLIADLKAANSANDQMCVERDGFKTELESAKVRLSDLMQQLKDGKVSCVCCA